MSYQSIVFIGNDVHYPYDEMTAVQIRNIREELNIPACHVVSIQTRKPVSSDAKERTIPFCGNGPGRFFQLLGLLFALNEIPVGQSRLLHYLGSGNPALNNALSIFARLTGRRILFSPLGLIHAPALMKDVYFSFLHERHGQISERFPKLRRRSRTIPPFTVFEPQPKPIKKDHPRILFCSVPPKEKEFTLKGIDFLLESMKRLNQTGLRTELTILNRHPHLSGALEKYVAKYGAGNVMVVNERIENMAAYMTGFSLIAAPFRHEMNVQVPMSVIEGFALGIPAIVQERICVAEDINAYGAGRTFSDMETYVSGITEVLANSGECGRNAIRLWREKYSRDANLKRLKDYYDFILDA